jgi:hypothetical protein
MEWFETSTEFLDAIAQVLGWRSSTSARTTWAEEKAGPVGSYRRGV